MCRDFPNYLPFALSPFEFLPLFAKTIASFSLSILLFRHARTHTYQSSRHKQHDNRRLLKIFPTFAFFFDNSSCQITRNRNRKPFLLRGWRRSLCSLRRDATFPFTCVYVCERVKNTQISRSLALCLCVSMCVCVKLSLDLTFCPRLKEFSPTKFTGSGPRRNTTLRRRKLTWVRACTYGCVLRKLSPPCVVWWWW